MEEEFSNAGRDELNAGRVEMNEERVEMNEERVEIKVVEEEVITSDIEKEAIEQKEIQQHELSRLEKELKEHNSELRILEDCKKNAFKNQQLAVKAIQNVENDTYYEPYSHLKAVDLETLNTKHESISTSLANIKIKIFVIQKEKEKSQKLFHQYHHNNGLEKCRSFIKLKTKNLISKSNRKGSRSWRRSRDVLRNHTKKNKNKKNKN